MTFGLLLSVLMGIFGFLAIFCIVMFFVSFKSQKDYDEDSLPELMATKVKEDTPESLFELENDPLDELDSLDESIPLPEYESRQSVKAARRGMRRPKS